MDIKPSFAKGACAAVLTAGLFGAFALAPVPALANNMPAGAGAQVADGAQIVAIDLAGSDAAEASASVAQPSCETVTSNVVGGALRAMQL